MKHCPICNASSDKVRFFGEFCENCLSAKLQAQLPASVALQKCKECGMVRFGRDYLVMDKDNTEKAMKSLYNGYKVKLLSQDPVRVSIKDTESGLIIDKDVTIEYGKTLCENCARRHGGYFESTIQFRGSTEKINRLIVALQRYLEKNNGYVSKIVDVDNGVDVSVSSKQLTTTFLSRKQLNHTDSYTLHTEKRGKKLYRSTYSVRV
ncbi:NMD3 family protein [uncultured archaeon]|nr:NMD3 family protein [uncultured archaeon]